MTYINSFWESEGADAKRTKLEELLKGIEAMDLFDFSSLLPLDARAPLRGRILPTCAGSET